MVKKSYAKVNIFLKIVGTKENYHLLASRFARVKNLFDIIEFQKGDFNSFTLEGNFGCTTEKNTIYKAYKQLIKISNDVEKYFTMHKVTVIKNIPEFAGLGGGSSNAATFMLMVNEVCNLRLSKDTLAKIGATIGADIPFFIYEYDSANVSGIGEIVKPFEEETLDITTITPPIQCNTGAIFKRYREQFYKNISSSEIDKLFSTKSIDIYHNLSIDQANDLYLPAISVNNQLVRENLNINNQALFSGSGSSFFNINQRG